MSSDQRVHSRDVTGYDRGLSEELAEWENQRLIETYQRLSRDLKRRGFDVDTVHRMGCVEVELRDRDIDPERTVDDLWD